MKTGRRARRVDRPQSHGVVVQTFGLECGCCALLRRETVDESLGATRPLAAHRDDERVPHTGGVIAREKRIRQRIDFVHPTRTRQGKQELVGGTGSACVAKKRNGLLVVAGHPEGARMLEPRLVADEPVFGLEKPAEDEIGRRGVARLDLTTSQSQHRVVGEPAGWQNRGPGEWLERL